MGHKVLLADDSITVQKIVKLSLTEEGIEVIALGNGEEAVQQLETLQPDLVMADVFMPGKDGYEVCEHVKAHPQFRNTPVLLLVHAFEPFDPDRARKVGADQQLTKPFQSIRTLVTTVQDLLATPQSSAVRASETATVARAVSATEPIAPLTPAPPLSNQSDEECAMVSSLTAQTTMGDSSTAMEQMPQVVSAPASLEPVTALSFSESTLPLPQPDANILSETANMDFTSPLELSMLPNMDWQANDTSPSAAIAPELDAVSLSSFSLASSTDVAEDVLDLSEVLSTNQSSVSASPGTSSTLKGANDVALLSVLSSINEPKMPKEVRIQTPAEAEASALMKSFDMGVGHINLDASVPMLPVKANQTLPIISGTHATSDTASVMRNDVMTALPEAIIEEIVQRVIQRLSTQTIQEIAWEVVPEMAELLIRQQLSQQRLAP
jgi:CheY-like chemotaxis protein